MSNVFEGIGLEIPMIEAAINWVTYKAYELEGEKKANLLAVLNSAKKEYEDIKAERDALRDDLAVSLAGNEEADVQVAAEDSTATIIRLQGLLRRERYEVLHDRGCDCDLCVAVDAELKEARDHVK